MPRAVRLTGRLVEVDGNPVLELVEKREGHDGAVTQLDIEADDDPVRIELHDFDADGCRWVFDDGQGWARDACGGEFSFKDFGYTEQDRVHEVEFMGAHSSSSAPPPPPPKVKIKIKPIVDAPGGRRAEVSAVS